MEPFILIGLTGVGATGVGHLLEESGGERDSAAECELGRLLGDTGGDGRLLLKNGFFEYSPNSCVLNSTGGDGGGFGVVLRSGVTERSEELAVGVMTPPSYPELDDEDGVLGESARGHPCSCKSSIEV
jgi:hypothetical protein